MAKTEPTPFQIFWQDRTVKVADLQPYERNPRRITKQAFEKLKQSLQRNGYYQPIIAQPSLLVIGGHQRIRALKELGVEEVTVRVPHRELTFEEFRRILVTDNLPFGEFDFEMLSADFEKEELLDWGMSAEMLDDFKDAGVSGLTDPDEVPAEQPVVIAREGDVWLLGQHRIVCGDSTAAHVVQSLLIGATPGLMVTDPPYGVEYDASWRTKAGVGSTGAAVGKVLNDDRADWGDAWALFPGNVAYVWHGGLHAPTVAKSLTEHGFNLRAQIIWVKTRAALSRGHYHWQHEPAFYAQKPVMCMQRPIENNSDKGGGVYDPFLGSGSTLIAATVTGRVCYGCELNPSYVDVIIRRWQNFTGREATLEGTNETFRALEASRPASK